MRPTATPFLHAALVLTACLSGLVPLVARAADEPHEVRAVRPEAKETDVTYRVSGLVVPYRQVDVRAQVSGVCREVLHELGDVVQEGDVLAVLDVTLWEHRRAALKAEVQRLEAEREQAAARLRLAVAETEGAQSRAAAVEAEVARAKAEVATAADQVERVEKLQRAAAISTQEVARAKQQLLAAQAKVAAAEDQARVTQARDATSQVRIRLAEASLEAAEAAVEAAQHRLVESETMLGYGTLRAPFGGVVTARSVEVGELVPAADGAGSPLFQVAEIDRLRVVVEIADRSLFGARPGDPVAVELPGPAAGTVEATIARVAPGLMRPRSGRESSRLRAEIDLENPPGDERLLLGDEVEVSIPSRRVVQVLPASVLVDVPSSVRARMPGRMPFSVFVVTADDTLRQVRVDVARIDDRQVQIVASGLSADSRVVLSPAPRLRSGEKVRVVDSATP